MQLAAATALWRERETSVLLLIVNQLYQLKDYAEALQVMESIVVMHPDKLVHLSQLARLYLQMGNISSAAHVLQRIEKRLAFMRSQAQDIAPADEQRHNRDR